MLFKSWEQHHRNESGHEKLDSPYTRFLCTELILRDQLAIDRTILANERTLLAYFRTSLALVVTGAGFIKFFVSRSYCITGYTFIALSALVMIFGVYRAAKVSARIRQAGAGMESHHGKVCGITSDTGIGKDDQSED